MPVHWSDRQQAETCLSLARSTADPELARRYEQLALELLQCAQRSEAEPGKEAAAAPPSADTKTPA